MAISTNLSRVKQYLYRNSFISGMREKGGLWKFHKLFKLIKLQLNGCIRFVQSNSRSIIDNIRYRAKKQSNVLYAFYDLAVSATSFDIISFLLLAELERKEKGCDSLHTVIVPGPNEGFRADGFKDYDVEDKRWRLKNILVPCCWLIPSCQNVTVCTSREEAGALRASLAKYVFPKGYTVSFPKERYAFGHIIDVCSKGAILPSIQIMPRAHLFAKDWIQSKCGGRKVVTISLRECLYQENRNSNLKEWAKFAKSLDPVIYCPVIIRDMELSLKPLPPELEGLTIFREASWNLELRAALYEHSYLNMLVNGGLTGLCLYNRRVRCLIFKMITSDKGICSEKFFRSNNFEIGSQLLYATPFQRLVWEDDSFEVIQEEFIKMCGRIEGALIGASQGAG